MVEEADGSDLDGGSVCLRGDLTPGEVDEPDDELPEFNADPPGDASFCLRVVAALCLFSSSSFSLFSFELVPAVETFGSFGVTTLWIAPDDDSSSRFLVASYSASSRGSR